MDKDRLCGCCTAAGGLFSDRCSRCDDFSLFETPNFSMTRLEGLTDQGKLAWILFQLSALKDRQDED